MEDDVLTRNSSDELALRVTQSSGDTGTNKEDVYTRDSQGRLAVRTVGGSGGGGATSASQVSMTPLSVINASDVQAGLQIVNTELTGIQNQIGDISTALTAILGE